MIMTGRATCVVVSVLCDFFCFTGRGPRCGFTHDDLMNLYKSWHLPVTEHMRPSVSVAPLKYRPPGRGLADKTVATSWRTPQCPAASPAEPGDPYRSSGYRTDYHPSAYLERAFYLLSQALYSPQWLTFCLSASWLQYRSGPVRLRFASRLPGCQSAFCRLLSFQGESSMPPR